MIDKTSLTYAREVLSLIDHRLSKGRRSNRIMSSRKAMNKFQLMLKEGSDKHFQGGERA